MVHFEVPLGQLTAESPGIDQAQTFWLEQLQESDLYNAWTFSQLRPYVSGEVLEVGCGTGNFTELLAPCSNQLLALDISEAYVAATQARLKHCPQVEVRQADVTQIQWERQFDTIVLLDVLEHIEDDRALLRQLGSWLKPGGHLIVKVPALGWLYSPMDEAIGHYRRYTHHTLAQSFQATHFSPPVLWCFNLGGILGWWWNGRVLRRTTPPSAQVGLFNRLVPLLRWAEGIVRPPVGLSLIAIGQRPL